VNTDARFAPHRQIAAASGFRAVHSTPLVDTRGCLVGVLSTHYPRPYRPPASDLELMKRFGELIGHAVEACLEADGQAAFSRLSALTGRHRGEPVGILPGAHRARPAGRRAWQRGAAVPSES
jgi:GAF domain-containing protein